MSAPSAINNSQFLIVGGTATKTTDNINGANFKASTGEVGLFDKHGVRLTEASAATATEFIVAVSRGASLPPIQSDVIVKSSLANVGVKVYSAAVEQSVAVGYNGTSGAIEDIASYAGELYTDRIIFSMFMSGTDDERIKRGDYQSLLTAGQADVALGIVGSLVKNFDREVSNSSGDKPIVFKAICNNAGAANTGAGTITVSKGSKQVLFGTDVDAVAVVGDYIRFDESQGGSPAVTDGVYKIVAIDATNETLTLDRPYSAASAAAIAEGNAVIITAALGAAADWGYVKTGTVLDYRLGKSKYKKVRWEGQLSKSFGSTPVTVLSSPSEGNGTVTKMAELENFLNGYYGEQYRMGQPLLFDSVDNVLVSSAVAGGGYDIISFNHAHTLTGFTNTVSKKQLFIATPATTPNYCLAATANDITDVLEVLAFGAAGGELALT